MHSHQGQARGRPPTHKIAPSTSVRASRPVRTQTRDHTLTSSTALAPVGSQILGTSLGPESCTSDLPAWPDPPPPPPTTRTKNSTRRHSTLAAAGATHRAAAAQQPSMASTHRSSPLPSGGRDARARSDQRLLASRRAAPSMPPKPPDDARLLSVPLHRHARHPPLARPSPPRSPRRRRRRPPRSSLCRPRCTQHPRTHSSLRPVGWWPAV